MVTVTAVALILIPEGRAFRPTATPSYPVLAHVVAPTTMNQFLLPETDMEEVLLMAIPTTATTTVLLTDVNHQPDIAEKAPLHRVSTPGRGHLLM